MLISLLSPERSWVVQTAASDFIKAIITISANASHNEQVCIGPNDLTRQLVSKPCVEQLIQCMLAGGNSLITGVSIVIEVIRKNNSDYDPDVCADPNAPLTSRDPIYLGTLLRLFAQNVSNFMALMANAPTQHVRHDSSFGERIEPLGFDRFKTCELMAELLHCSNMALMSEVGAEEAIAARDAERHRLRIEGTLPLYRNGEKAPPDAVGHRMTLQSSHPLEEGRRLEVTNIADDDGFEEVEHSRDMNEDTLHEFVNAEEEMAALPVSSLLDKDEDEFVDEPLNSPQLQSQDKHVSTTPQFDIPDLYVAPLTPKKKAKDSTLDASQTVEKDAAPDEPDIRAEADDASSATTGEPSEPTLEKLNIKDEETPQPVPEHPTETEDEPQETQEQKEGPGNPSSETFVAEPINETDKLSDTEGLSVGTEVVVPLGMADRPEEAPGSTSPRLEDAPASLFLAKKGPLAEETRMGSGVDNDDSVEFPDYSAAGIGENDSDVRDSSTISTQYDGHLTQQQRPARQTDPSQPAAPVVGDFLKMQFVAHDVVPTILVSRDVCPGLLARACVPLANPVQSFFFRYPWNNFLHNVVYDIIQQVFNGPMDRGYNPTLAVSLFDEPADITVSIMKGQATSDEYHAKTKTRLGYMGHLTLIAEEVIKFAERNPPEMLSDTVLDKVTSIEWNNYVDGSLAETRQRDNAILGGVRPEPIHRTGMGGNPLAAVGLSNMVTPGIGSNALAEAGLNGAIGLDETGGNGIGPFNIGVGSLLSGFGSSSDEEEEGEGHDEDVNNEVSRLRFPISYSSSSSSSDWEDFDDDDELDALVFPSHVMSPSLEIARPQAPVDWLASQDLYPTETSLDLAH